MEKLLTVEEAAEALACSVAGIRRWISQRKLPVVKVGRIVRLRARDLEGLVTAGYQPPLLPVPYKVPCLAVRGHWSAHIDKGEP
jgi:excisionase family DNA binding protein